MKIKFLLLCIILSTQIDLTLHLLITAGLEFASSILNLGTSIISLVQENKAEHAMSTMLKDFSGDANNILDKLNNLYDKQLQQNNENFMNTMLKLNSIEGSFNSLTCQVTSIHGDLIDVTKMLNNMDGRMIKIMDLVSSVDHKMDKISEQVLIG
jgi:hypothetical protein